MARFFIKNFIESKAKSLEDNLINKSILFGQCFIILQIFKKRDDRLDGFRIVEFLRLLAVLEDFLFNLLRFADAVVVPPAIDGGIGQDELFYFFKTGLSIFFLLFLAIDHGILVLHLGIVDEIVAEVFGLNGPLEFAVVFALIAIAGVVVEVELLLDFVDVLEQVGKGLLGDLFSVEAFESPAFGVGNQLLVNFGHFDFLLNDLLLLHGLAALEKQFLGNQIGVGLVGEHLQSLNRQFEVFEEFVPVLGLVHVEDDLVLDDVIGVLQSGDELVVGPGVVGVF